MKSFFKLSSIALAGFVAGMAFLYLLHMLNRPDLSPWHQAHLLKDITAEQMQQMSGLDQYIEQEVALFSELEKSFSPNDDLAKTPQLNRYISGSWSDPFRFEQNWNRTVELPTASPGAVVLMLHGLSDSPYSFRSLALSLNKRGAWVVALRLPGHGTVPGGLVDVDWRDFSAAVRLAASHLKQKAAADVPFFIVGYSNGAALALEYTLSGILEEDLRIPDGLVMISPATAVSKLASVANINLQLSRLPGLKKVGWLSLEPEYDPYKYNSFAINAGKQIYQLIRRVNRLLDLAQNKGAMKDFPLVTAFQSVVDATIPPAALINSFLARLTPSSHQLVLFDVNQAAADRALLNNKMAPVIQSMRNQLLPYDFTLLTNRSSDSLLTEERTQKAMTTEVQRHDLTLAWPPGTYSLSHVALPFPPSDELYGAKVKGAGGFTLGSLEPRGEKGVLQVPMSNLMRMRYNPFYAYLEQKTIQAIFREN